MTTVVIGCKLPNGLLMELITPHSRPESLMPGPPGKRVKLNGANTNVIARLNPADPAYGVTEVEEGFAKAWFKANADADYIKNGIIFMVASQAAFKAEAMDRHEEVRTKLEPLNPEPAKDARIVAPADEKHLAALKTAKVA